MKSKLELEKEIREYLRTVFLPIIFLTTLMSVFFYFVKELYFIIVLAVTLVIWVLLFFGLVKKDMQLSKNKRK